MKLNIDNLISKLTVRLKDQDTKRVIGTGVIYYNENLKDKVYIITASHCLFEDTDFFTSIYNSILIDFYNSTTNKYYTYKVNTLNENLLFKDEDKDVAIITLNKFDLVKLVNSIPSIKVSSNRQSYNDFIIKGFPNATEGKELASIRPIWVQQMPEVLKFQLQLNEDYSLYNIQGFSGSGVFLYDGNDIYLYGIFTRFREEDKGRVIYCQNISLTNELLKMNFLPTLKFSYLGNQNLNHSFFEIHIKKAIKNLGPRYNEKLNLELPISKIFNDLVRDKKFKYRFLQLFDDWSVKVKENLNSELSEVLTAQFKLKEEIRCWLEKKPIGIPNTINVDWITSRIDEINQLNQKNRSILLERQNKLVEKFKETDEKYKYTKQPFESEIDQLKRIEKRNHHFLNDLERRVNFRITNYPVCILKGEAGSGKSHLLGDIALNRLKKEMPSILLLGQQFKVNKSVESNIIELLGLNCSFEMMLKSLNEIGRQLGSRVPIFIDALNEGAGFDLWRDEIAGLIDRVSAFPFLGLVLSVRTTYFDLLIPDNLDPSVSIIEHNGFRGNEYAALKLFCNHYGLKQPNFPILSPEFTKPLFLILICEGVKDSSQKTFPQGFQGIEKIFRYYIQALEKRFALLRPEYRLATSLINEAISKFSIECFNKEDRVFKLKEADDFFMEKFARYPNLLSDLIQESVFIRNHRASYSSGEREEILYFAYERFGDYFIAKEIISKFKTSKEVICAFSKNTLLGNLIDDEWYNKGVLEALAIVIPEKYNLELFEVYNWWIIEDEEEKRHSLNYLNCFLMDSLKWRTVESINHSKLVNWIKGDYFNYDKDQYLCRVLELTTIKGHPFNSDKLFQILSKHKMPKRDSFWQPHMRLYQGYGGNNEAFPIRRLIDWAWSYGISFRVDIEIATLAAQTLAWVLSSTMKSLRDEVTKAMVNLLEQKPDALIAVLNKFKKIDDAYIHERLYAIAYGCVLRTKRDSGIKKIGTFVYNEIFKKGRPPENILLRDYARNIVEYALYKNQLIKIDKKKITPPFKSNLPEFPSEEEISQFYISHNDPEYDEEYGRTYNEIHVSVMTLDFGRKIIKPVLKKFNPISFTNERKYNFFLKNLSKTQNTLVSTLAEIQFKIGLFTSMRDFEIERYGGKNKHEKTLTLLNDIQNSLYKDIDTLAIDQVEKIKQEIIPYLVTKTKLDNSSYHHDLFATKPVRRWIVRRVFELGYNIKLHGYYDKNYCNEYRNPEVESISTKYQWIAFHQILSILSDNYKVKNWHKQGYEYYQGPWELGVRNIDPAYITKNNQEERKDEMKILENLNEWWSDQNYNYWEQENYEWVRVVKDLPPINQVIQKSDSSGVKWLFLNKYKEWKSPKPFGVDKYSVYRKEIWYLIKGYLIEKEDKNKIISFLENKNFLGPWMPENHEEFEQVFNREKYWAPICKNSDNSKVWQKIYYQQKLTKFKVLPCCVDSKGHIHEDKSGAESPYQIPCETLFKGLGLKYSLLDGFLENMDERIVVQNIPNSGGIMIDQEMLMNYLEQNELDIIWTVLGEKMAFLSHGYTNYFSSPCGVFYLEDGEVKGKLNYHDRE